MGVGSRSGKENGIGLGHHYNRGGGDTMTLDYRPTRLQGCEGRAGENHRGDVRLAGCAIEGTGIEIAREIHSFDCKWH